MSQPTTASAQVSAAPASLGRRAGAYLIDLAISTVVLVVAAVIGVAVAQPAGIRDDAALAMAILAVYGVVALIGLVWVVVYTWMQGGRGSVGQRLVRIRLADAENSAPIGFGRALLRNLIWGLAAYVIVGYFSVLFDSSGRRQGWHDKVANTLVVNTTDAGGRGSTSAPAAAAQLPSAAAQATATAVASALPPVPGSAPVFPGAAAFAPPAFPAPATGVPPVPPLPMPSQPVSPPPVSPQSVSPVQSPEPSRSAPTGPGAMISSVPGITIDPEPAASRTPTAPVAAPAPAAPLSPPQVSAPPAPRAEAAPATDELDIDETRAAAPAPATAPAASRELTVLSWDDGTRTAVYTRTLFGRNPAREDGAVVASIRDETLSLSKTHFEIGPAADGVYVLDRHSTNGTTLVRGGGRQQLVAGTRTTLVAGDVLEFGDRRATVGERS
ncbi:RDD family protein [Microbacterium sp. SLBN-146]|uniref:RDD family protein n=1 Tax=Microbacterium sp. SLBN-146 TaxID=2768457 RepID=UPI00115089FE|nr:RDD family protein [Microbacterium sp. SLBN-146]TQJ30566.1 putative RDD family membrane protein YckC [Microbacterium sp. SLBN-146]